MCQNPRQRECFRDEASVKETGLNDKTVIVTGAAAGIGRATAQLFAQHGARVSLWDVNEPGLRAAADDIASQHGRTDYAVVDVTDRHSVEAAIADLIADWGRVDVLINNAGIVRDAQLVKWQDDALVSAMSDETFDAVMSVNLRGVFLCTRSVVPHMIARGGGVILNASSVVGLYGNFGQTNYAAAKSGVIAFTKTWARELGKYNIRVNCVAPGFIATDMVRSIPQKIVDRMTAHTPLGRLGEPDDIAHAYVWLASDQAKFVHGAVLSVDGGLVLGT
jgi:3-oxoacyl-[acyl-carrier protein] reductase